MTAFVDSSFYIATIVKGDQWAEAARTAPIQDARLVTSSLVVNETAAFLQAKGFSSAAIQFLSEARASDRVQLITVDAVLQAEAWDLFARWAGIGASPVDCASFAIMRKFGMKRALTFDKYFAAAGFEILC